MEPEATSDQNIAASFPGHIELTPGVCGGKPRIRRTRIRVQDVAMWHERLGISADEIVSRFPQLTLAGVYAALAYFYDHREEIHLQISSADALVEELRQQHPSRLRGRFPLGE